jgi:hypothetical protein
MDLNNSVADFVLASSELNRSAIAKGAVIGVVGVLIIAGAIGIYFYTSPGASKTSSASSSLASVTGSQTQTNASQLGPTGGTCVRNGQGQCTQAEGVWAQYLGYIPTGYTLAPLYANVPDFSCPSGMSTTQCALFKQSCGNGVCDPNESCASCPIDCGTTGSLLCDPYTGRPGIPSSVCQAIVEANGNGAFG